MFTPVAALTWENAQQVRRGLPWILLTLLGIPLTVTAFFVLQGAKWSELQEVAMSPPAQMIYTVLSLMITLTWMGSLFGSPVRLFALPVATSTLVRTRILFGMACCAGLYLVTALALNLLLNAGWSVWSPAVHFAVAFALQQAFAWTLRGRSNAQGLALLMVGPPVLFWVTARFGAEWIYNPQHRWEDLTGPQILMLGTVTALAFFAAEWGAARDRRGAPLNLSLRSDGTAVAQSAEVFWAPVRPRAFKSAWLAQFWYEWREDGWFIPAITFILASIGLLLHFFFFFYYPTYARMPEVIGEGLAILSTGIVLQAALPLFAREYTSHGRRTRTQRFGMSPLLPMSDAALAWAALMRGIASAATAVVLMVLLGMIFVVVQLFLWRVEGRPDLAQDSLTRFMFGNQGRIQIRMTWETLLQVAVFATCLWTSLGLSYAAVLCGRRWLAALPMSLPFLFVLFMVTRTNAPVAVGDGFDIIMLFMVPCWTMLAFGDALYRGAIGWKSVVAAGFAWCLGFTLLVIVPVVVAEILPGRNPLMPMSAVIAAGIVLLLPILPFAAAPLALHRNRHR